MSAIKPDFFHNMPSLQTRVSKTPVSSDESALHEMAQSRGWKILKELMEQASKELEITNKNAIAQGLPLEEIGRNAVVISLAQGVIERLLNKVADATEACLKDE